MLSTVLDKKSKEVVENKIMEHMAWGYSVITIDCIAEKEYHLHVAMDLKGSAGSPAKFDIKCAIMHDVDINYLPVISITDDHYDTSFVLEEDTSVVIVMTAMPDHFYNGEIFKADLLIEAE